MSEVKEIDQEAFDRIMNTYQLGLNPGRFILKSKNGVFTAVDNSTGDAWTESFLTEKLARKWANGDIELEDLERCDTCETYGKTGSMRPVGKLTGICAFGHSEEIVKTYWRCKHCAEGTPKWRKFGNPEAFSKFSEHLGACCENPETECVTAKMRIVKPGLQWYKAKFVCKSCGNESVLQLKNIKNGE